MNRPERNERGPERLLAKAQAEIEAGRLWRAREKLQGAMRSYPADVRVLEAYGRLLDRLGDRVQAGKFLFLSGVRGPDVDEAIALFISRHGKGHLNSLTAQFPRAVRRVGLGAFPAVVMLELEQLGLPEAQVKEDSFDPVDPNFGVRQSLGVLGCGLVALVLLVAAVVGLATMFKWVFGSSAEQPGASGVSVMVDRVGGTEVVRSTGDAPLVQVDAMFTLGDNLAEGTLWEVITRDSLDVPYVHLARVRADADG